jgi:hypothetical protein
MDHGIVGVIQLFNSNNIIYPKIKLKIEPHIMLDF